ncbi:membrane protein insertase YidC [Capnocytophaga sp. oral taxon 336]|uniref:membrane protein insertase YidC n=1 Tax=Capnocytophaga sp. oral taxon 336 TaxID=712216 RepID=UPI00034E6B3C|nr:membrane protein insertase YidC [Capnocytophaga sp. oral taxon 336]EPE00046.1 membrane protein insertase, YidC/Oxa1 family domain [Capnocytophaga sp. oral taxon 336 str. F0502]
MEEKKFDLKSIIGFTLIFILLIWFMNNNKPSEEELAKRKAQQEQQANQATNTQKDTHTATFQGIPTDSVALEKYKASLGVFAYSATLPSAKDGVTVLENKDIKLTISNRGGQPKEVLLKEFKTYDSLPVYLIKDWNATFNLSFTTAQNQTLSSKDLYFEPTLSENNGNKVLSMKLKTSENAYLEYVYTLPKEGYMLDVAVRSQGLSGVVNTSKPMNIDWKLQARRMEKSVTYENRYTQATVQYDGDRISRLSQGGNDEQKEEKVNWVAYKQHLFTSVLISDNPFAKGDFVSHNIAVSEGKDVKYTKNFLTSLPIQAKSGELSESLHFYFGPSDYNVLKQYNDKYELTELIPLGWGIFGWLNKWLFIPLYNFLTDYFSVGLVIILMTIIVRLLLSPIVYKSYVSQAKMKVLRPEIEEINKKYEEPMKRQQETMALYNKAGVNPLSGCIPALLQLPVFLALFNFFPTEFGLRQKSFLWAHDLSSYDAIFELPFSIPFYGSHVSLFPLLASVAIFIYSMMTMAQTAQPQQPGMPNMKFLIYLSPVMMLFFFNNYASGLSLYYFISNLLTIGIMLAIKYWIIDEQKIHTQIQENKKKPKKESKFQAKMREMMEQAEAQRKAQQKR